MRAWVGLLVGLRCPSTSGAGLNILPRAAGCSNPPLSLRTNGGVMIREGLDVKERGLLC